MHPLNGLPGHSTLELPEEIPNLGRREEEAKWVFYKPRVGRKKPKTTACSRASHCSLRPANPVLRVTVTLPRVSGQGPGVTSYLIKMQGPGLSGSSPSQGPLTA